jgi:hypothetical protein
MIIRIVAAIYVAVVLLFVWALMAMIAATIPPQRDQTAEWKAYQRAIMTPEGAAPASAP